MGIILHCVNFHDRKWSKEVHEGMLQWLVSREYDFIIIHSPDAYISWSNVCICWAAERLFAFQEESPNPEVSNVFVVYMIVVAVRKYIILGTILYLVSSWCVYSHYHKVQLKVTLIFEIIRITQLQSIESAELSVIEQTVCTKWLRFTTHRR
jgi:hypothetical protein